jgi:hypothetical protein
MSEIQKKRVRPIERKGKSILKVDNGKEKFFKDVKGTPMPKKARSLCQGNCKFSSDPCPELPVVSASSVVRATNPLSCFRPPSAKKRKVGEPTLMITDTEEQFEETPSLHPLDYVGMDTCSARSVSSEVSDFLYVDRSSKAVNSVELNGVGAGGLLFWEEGRCLYRPLIAKAGRLSCWIQRVFWWQAELNKLA